MAQTLIRAEPILLNVSTACDHNQTLKRQSVLPSTHCTAKTWGVTAQLATTPAKDVKTVFDLSSLTGCSDISDVRSTNSSVEGLISVHLMMKRSLILNTSLQTGLNTTLDRDTGHIAAAQTRKAVVGMNQRQMYAVIPV